MSNDRRVRDIVVSCKPQRSRSESYLRSQVFTLNLFTCPLVSASALAQLRSVLRKLPSLFVSRFDLTTDGSPSLAWFHTIFRTHSLSLCLRSPFWLTPRFNRRPERDKVPQIRKAHLLIAAVERGI